MTNPEILQLALDVTFSGVLSGFSTGLLYTTFGKSDKLF